MNMNTDKYDKLKNFISYQEMRSILVSALSHRNLAKLVNKLKLNSRDVKTIQIPSGELAGLLVESAFSDTNIFNEVGGILDLYSAEAIKALKNGQFDDFRKSTLKVKGHREKTNIARLIWALLMDNSPGKMTEGKRLISELTYKDKNIVPDKTDTENGENIAGKNRENKTQKRQRHVPSKGKTARNGNSNFESETKRLKGEIESLKKKNSKLLNQLKHIRDPEKIKDLGKKINLLELENKDVKEKINKDYVPKDEFDALKKETDRLYQLYITSEKGARKDANVQEKCPFNDISFWKRLKNRIYERYPIFKHRPFFKKGKNCRVGIFVDVQNMFYSAKNLYHGRLDFEKFLELALQGRKLVQATAYIVKTPEIDQSKFINLLKNNEYVVKTIDLKTGMNGYAKGNWDVGMVMDIFELADKLDVIALASGDGDFVPLVKYLQKRGIRVEVYAFAYNTAIDLKECADKFYPLQEDILIKDQRGMVKQH
ncbi:MAG: NYN domain-containing protein [bacterium]